MTLPAPTPAEVARMVARYAAGASVNDLAKAFGTGARQVRKALQAAGVTLKTRGGGKKQEWEGPKP